MITEARIKHRLQNSQRLRYLRRKIHDVRKIVAGDYSGVDGTASNQALSEAQTRPEGLYDIMVTEIREGSSNLILQAIRTLCFQTAFGFPDISYADLTDEESMMNQLYLSARLGPQPRGCDAASQMRMALLDYMTGGLGWVWCGLADGVPVVRYVDTLDMSWDLDAQTIPDIGWASARVRRPLWEWVDEFGKKPFSRLFASGDAGVEEQIVECEYYYDAAGPAGNFAVFLVSGQEALELVEKSANPHFYDWDGIRQPFIPFTPMFHFQLPSVKYPVSIAETMIANQLGYRACEDYLNKTVQMGKPLYEVVKGSLDQDQLDNLENGEFGGVILRNEGQSAITIHSGLEIPQTVLRYFDHNKQEIVANGGANPYAGGNKVEGVSYAAEVNAIQAAAGLMSATITRDHASHWSRVVMNVQANAAAYDRKPLRLNYQGVELAFDKALPISRFLRPDAIPSVSEDSVKYQPRAAKIAQAQQVLMTVSQPAIAQLFPNALRHALSDFLLANGKENVDQWMTPGSPQAAHPSA